MHYQRQRRTGRVEATRAPEHQDSRRARANTDRLQGLLRVMFGDALAGSRAEVTGSKRSHAEIDGRFFANSTLHAFVRRGWVRKVARPPGYSLTAAGYKATQRARG